MISPKLLTGKRETAKEFFFLSGGEDLWGVGELKEVKAQHILQS